MWMWRGWRSKVADTLGVLHSTETYTTAVGAVSVRRTLYRYARERAVVPMELRAGIVEGHWTPLAARQASRVVAQMTPSEGEAVAARARQHGAVEEFAGPFAQGTECAVGGKARSVRIDVARGDGGPDEAVTVAASLDGVMVPMKDAQRAEKRERSRARGRRAKGPAGYQEAGCASLSFYDAEGERLDTLCVARMPEPKKRRR